MFCLSILSKEADKMNILNVKERKSIKKQAGLLISIGSVYFWLCILLYLKKDMMMAFAMLGMTVIYVVVGIVFLSIAKNSFFKSRNKVSC